MIPTPEQFLAKLAASPADGAEFDRYAPGITRREHVEATLTAVKATIAENSASKAKIAATKAKLAAIETAKISQSFMKPTPSPTKASTVTAASFATQPLLMARAEFEKLSHTDRNRFFKTGGKLV